MLAAGNFVDRYSSIGCCRWANRYQPKVSSRCENRRSDEMTSGNTRLKTNPKD